MKNEVPRVGEVYHRRVKPLDLLPKSKPNFADRWETAWVRSVGSCSPYMVGYRHDSADRPATHQLPMARFLESFRSGPAPAPTFSKSGQSCESEQGRNSVFVRRSLRLAYLRERRARFLLLSES